MGVCSGGSRSEHWTDSRGRVPGLDPLTRAPMATATKTQLAVVLTGIGGGRVWDRTGLRIR